MFADCRDPPVWTKHPEDNIYALIGSDASFIWDYDSKGDTLEFAKWGETEQNAVKKFFLFIASPKANATVIASKTGKVEWLPNATMIFINVTLADNGNYGCSLDFTSGEHLFDSTTLTVVSKYNKHLYLHLFSLLKPGFHQANYDHDKDQFCVKTKR